MGCVASGGDNNSGSNDGSTKSKGKHWDVDTSGNGNGQAKLGDSNMANYGSKEHKEKNYKIAESEKEWNEAVKEKDNSGIHMWRVHNKRSESKANDPDIPIFGIETVKETDYGTFFNGDCYIILHKYKIPGKSQLSQETMLYDAHFWLGGQSSQDEWGVAAYKTVELDDRFRGKVVQYREVEGNESKKFLEIFGNNSKYNYKFLIKDGGYASGFRKVKDNNTQYKPARLLQILGDKANKIEAIPVKLDKTSLNNTDSFILYTGTGGGGTGNKMLDDNHDKLYQFNGSKATGFEKNYASQVISKIKAMAGQENLDTFVISGKTDNSGPALEFYKIFYGESCSNGDAIPDTRPSKSEIAKVLELYKVSNESGIMKCELIQSATEEGPSLDRSLLNTNDVFWVNCASNVFIWVGKNANRDERTQVYTFVESEMKALGHYSDVPQICIKEGSETSEFWEIFDGKITHNRVKSGGKWFGFLG